MITNQQQADVSIVCGAVSSDGIDNPSFSRVLAQANDKQVWICVPNVARFLISDGNKIVVDLLNADDLDTVSLYLMGSCIGAIIHQRGMLALHASAVDVNGQAVLFVGHSGMGKSTTAAIFHQRGYPVISDDTVAIDANGGIAGGFPQIKLWDKALARLDIEKTGLSQIRCQIDKFRLPIPEYSGDADAIAAIYSLNSHNSVEEGEFEFTRLEGLAKFGQLRKHTYRARIMDGVGGQQGHLALCSSLAKSTPITKIVRSPKGFNAIELVDRVLLDLQDPSQVKPSDAFTGTSEH